LRQDLCVFLSLGKGRKTTLEASDLRIDKLTVIPKEFDVVIDKIEVVLGSREILSLIYCFKID